MGSNTFQRTGLWLTGLMGEEGQSGRRVSERRSSFTDVVKPKQLVWEGLPSLGTSEIEALKKGIGFIILPDFFFFFFNWERALQLAFRIL